MLVFIHESGDLGFKFDRQSTPYYTLAAVVFSDGEAARSCEQAIEALAHRLKLPPGSEFHFSGDSHSRRLAFLEALTEATFEVETLTIDKTALATPGERGWLSYARSCEALLQRMEGLHNPHIIIDGSRERRAERHLMRELMSTEGLSLGLRLRSLRIARSQSDRLLQVADYFAGVFNRIHEEKRAAAAYEPLVRRRFMRQWFLP